MLPERFHLRRRDARHLVPCALAGDDLDMAVLHQPLDHILLVTESLGELALRDRFRIQFVGGALDLGQVDQDRLVAALGTEGTDPFQFPVDDEFGDVGA
jgi:hypothetical protein